MKRQRERAWVLPVAMLVALLLGVVSLPAPLQPLRPFWLALLVTYMVLETPDRFGLGRAFLLGLAADMVHGTLLGEYALRLVLLTALLYRFRSRMRFFPPTQQALVIGGLLLGDRVLVSALHLMVHQPVPGWMTWWSVIPAMVLWPVVFVLLDRLRLGSGAR